MGPLPTADLTAVDILTNASANHCTDTQDEKLAPPECAEDDRGRKAGRGFPESEWPLATAAC